MAPLLWHVRPADSRTAAATADTIGRNQEARMADRRARRTKGYLLKVLAGAGAGALVATGACSDQQSASDGGPDGSPADHVVGGGTQPATDSGLGYEVGTTGGGTMPAIDGGRDASDGGDGGNDAGDG
jgi:hypothetical protein